MRFVKSVPAAMLAAGFASACSSDPEACAEYYDDTRRNVLFIMQLVGTTPLYFNTCQPVLEIIVNGVTHPSDLFGTQMSCDSELQARCIRLGLSSDWQELGHTANATENWEGLFYEEKMQKPGGCQQWETAPPLDCWRGVAPPLGPMRVRATMYATKNCTGDGDCIYSDPVSATTDFVFGQDEAVKVLMSP